jgi:geranylgeranyl diphosphate synthase type II
MLVGGQADDLAGATAGDDLARLQAIHHRKTAAMILVSLELGALTAEATAEQHKALAAYGERFGQVFQITDDLLDARGDASQVGKRVGKDADRGKLTYTTLVGIEESRRLVERLVAEAQAVLDVFGDVAEPLRMLARRLVDRDK